jgi:hypothetical protein
MLKEVQLCRENGCLKAKGHGGAHSTTPSEVWRHFAGKDKKKLSKAGFATPRGGDKGGYQNHVSRNNMVIIPFERCGQVDFDQFHDGYSVRLLPPQCFESKGVLRQEFTAPGAIVRIGVNAFVLYGSHKMLDDYPPLPGWKVRSLWKNGKEVETREAGAVDAGHYIVRAPALGGKPARREGPPQGMFAPEYADEHTNYLARCVLAWLTIQTKGSPYTLAQAHHLQAVLKEAGLHDSKIFEQSGALRHGLTCCPLCTRVIRYDELHATVSFEDEEGLENAAVQTEGATRSTVVNLFHMHPVGYKELTHVPRHVAWGHAICNTRLGQRRCYSLGELQQMDLKVGVIRDEGLETFGWISDDYKMIRSEGGAVWIQLNGDFEDDGDFELSAAGDDEDAADALEDLMLDDQSEQSTDDA